MPLYILTEYSDNYSKASEILWHFYRDKPHDSAIKNSESFKSKVRITGKTLDYGNTKDVEIAAPLKYLSRYRKPLGTYLLNWEINLILTWSGHCVLRSLTDEGTYTETDAKLYVQVVLYQLKIMQNYSNNWNLILKEKLTGININQVTTKRKQWKQWNQSNNEKAKPTFR